MTINHYASYVIQVDLAASRPVSVTPDQNKLYIYEASDTGALSMWSVSDNDWVDLAGGGGGPADTDALPEGVTNLYFTDERAQDATGAMLDTSLVYVDGTPLLTRAALTGAITASQGSNTTALGSFTKAQLDTAVSDGNVLYVGDVTQYTDEMAQDAVGAMIGPSLVYVDGTPLLARAALTGAVTAAQDSNATTIASDAVTNAHMANMAQATVKGRQAAAGTGDPENLTASQLATVLGTAGLTTVKAAIGERLFPGTIADDTAVALNVGTSIQVGLCDIIGATDSAGVGICRFRTTATASMAIIAQVGTKINIVAGDGTLAGTTGPDTFLNVRTDSAGGNLYLENRTGTGRSYVVNIFR